ncbi:MAG: TrkA family potassium uptake protein [Dehalococcoidia bacterium]|nr:TrkA family potassium uptake protein [Dehalococcoidia bacterium]MYD29841.1 TrkA family potassium uptake protein [Dehalococcoidia bacterium]
MNVVIMGCGRTGAAIAASLDQDGHSVTVLDLNAGQFRRLPDSFGGRMAVGNGMDAEVLERAGAREADAFVAVTQGDNRNYFASQLAREIFGVKNVVCRTKDPERGEIFGHLGLQTYSPTSAGAEAILAMLPNSGPA